MTNLRIIQRRTDVTKTYGSFSSDLAVWERGAE
jgi:hypothetical protein